MSECAGLPRGDLAEGQLLEGSSPWPATTPVPRRIDEHLVALHSPSSFEAEPYRILLSALERARAGRPSLALAVTSAAPNDGKTTTSINLAAMLARPLGAKALLLDADLRRPSIAQRVGLEAQSDPDLERVLANPELVASEALITCPPLPMSVLTAPADDSLPLETLHSPAFESLMRAARQVYRYIVVDTPPVVALPDARALSSVVDTFLLVVRAGVTPRHLLAEALQALEPDKVLGLVFNGDQRPFGGYYGRYQRYYRAQHKRREA